MAMNVARVRNPIFSFIRQNIDWLMISSIAGTSPGHITTAMPAPTRGGGIRDSDFACVFSREG